ncbi:hypothetical protein ABTW72_25910 [Micromonospora sp. NPDC127501]|uniref:hypothetical protein n=1 Tax=Micromonospora sp. NPDC127501 TaxID=3154872 RepID=UPI00332D6478
MPGSRTGPSTTSRGTYAISSSGSGGTARSAGVREKSRLASAHAAVPRAVPERHPPLP